MLRFLDFFGPKLELQGLFSVIFTQKYLLSSSYVPGTVLGTGGIEWQIDLERTCLFLNYYDNRKTETSLLPFF